jgi:hypothetical protein
VDGAHTKQLESRMKSGQENCEGILWNNSRLIELLGYDSGSSLRRGLRYGVFEISRGPRETPQYQEYSTGSQIPGSQSFKNVQTLVARSL